MESDDITPPSTPTGAVLDGSMKTQSDTSLLLCVAGAHMEGQPLHHELTRRGCILVKRCQTAPVYNLYSLVNDGPMNAVLVHTADHHTGESIDVEVYEMSMDVVGSFLLDLPAPLALGSIELVDGSVVKGLVCEKRGVTGAWDITSFKSWKKYIATVKQSPTKTKSDKSVTGTTTSGMVQVETSSSLSIAVVGAHLEGMPLHHQLVSRNCKFIKKCRTAPVYNLYSLGSSKPMKPALVHTGCTYSGSSIEIEVYNMPMEEVGSFLMEIPAPLALGTVELEDGTSVKGFVSEPRAINGAYDITSFGSWRNYLKAIKSL